MLERRLSANEIQMLSDLAYPGFAAGYVDTEKLSSYLPGVDLDGIIEKQGLLREFEERAELARLDKAVAAYRDGKTFVQAAAQSGVETSDLVRFLRRRGLERTKAEDSPVAEMYRRLSGAV